MKGAPANKPQPQPDPANLSQAELASNEQATVVPWFCGERKFAVNWVTPIYNMYSKDGDASGKK
jgi:hypothetical protein